MLNPDTQLQPCRRSLVLTHYHWWCKCFIVCASVCVAGVYHQPVCMCVTLCGCVSLIPTWPGNETSGSVWHCVHTCVTLRIHGVCHECGCVILIPKWPGNETSRSVRHCVHTCVTLRIHGVCHECGCVILIPKWPGNETSGSVRHCVHTCVTLRIHGVCHECGCVILIPKWPGNETSGSMRHCVHTCETLHAHVCDTASTRVRHCVHTCVTLRIHGVCHECGCVILIPKWPGNETSGCVRHWERMIHAAHDVWDIAVHMYECTCDWDIVCERLFLQPGTREAWLWVVAIPAAPISFIAKDTKMQLWLCAPLMFETHQHVGVHDFT